MGCTEAAGFVTSSTKFTDIQAGWMFFTSISASVFSNNSLQIYVFSYTSFSHLHPLTLYPDLKDFWIFFFSVLKQNFPSQKEERLKVTVLLVGMGGERLIHWYTFHKRHYVRLENNCLENTVHILPTSCMSRKIVLLRMNYCFHLFL